MNESQKENLRLQRRLERQFCKKNNTLSKENPLLLPCVYKPACAQQPCYCAWNCYTEHAHINHQCDVCHEIPIKTLHFCTECTTPPAVYVMCSDCAQNYRHPCRDPMHCTDRHCTDAELQYFGSKRAGAATRTDSNFPLRETQAHENQISPLLNWLRNDFFHFCVSH